MKMASKNYREIEIDLLLEALRRLYGYDFSQYSRSLINRRVSHRIQQEGLRHVSDLIHKVLTEPECFEKILQDFSINTTEMFRDPEFYLEFRGLLSSRFPSAEPIKIWDAGCSTGEEAYSLAIILEEESYPANSLIYATDFNERVLDTTRAGIYPLSKFQLYHRNYLEAGGQHSLSHYVTAHYGSFKMAQKLSERLVVANHNLVTDSPFAEVDIIVCRNVLIYFDKELQERVFGLFWDSLKPGGLLCLGPHETVRFSKISDGLDVVNNPLRIYQKKINTDVKNIAI